MYTAMEVLEGECRMEQALIRDKRWRSLALLPISKNRQKYNVTKDSMSLLIDILKDMKFQYVFIDCPAGISVGCSVDTSFGCSVGMSAGCSVGTSVGSSVDCSVGMSVGSSVDSLVGTSVGGSISTSVGCSVGCSIGTSASTARGAAPRWCGAAAWARAPPARPRRR